MRKFGIFLVCSGLLIAAGFIIYSKVVEKPFPQYPSDAETEFNRMVAETITQNVLKNLYTGEDLVLREISKALSGKDTGVVLGHPDLIENTVAVSVQDDNSGEHLLTLVVRLDATELKVIEVVYLSPSYENLKKSQADVSAE